MVFGSRCLGSVQAFNISSTNRLYLFTRRTAGVVQIGEAIGQPRPQMEKRRGGLPRDAAITVGRTDRDTFKQAKHRPQPLYAVEGCNQMHFRGAGIGETGIDAAIDQGLKQ
jgi:hypothetical protein